MQFQLDSDGLDFRGRVDFSGVGPLHSGLALRAQLSALRWKLYVAASPSSAWQASLRPPLLTVSRQAAACGHFSYMLLPCGIQVLNAIYAEIEKVTKFIGVDAGDLRQVFFVEYIELALTLRKTRVSDAARGELAAGAACSGPAAAWLWCPGLQQAVDSAYATRCASEQLVSRPPSGEPPTHTPFPATRCARPAPAPPLPAP